MVTIVISSRASIQSDSVSESARVSEFVVIRPGAVVHDDVVLEAHVVVESGATIGPGSHVFHGAIIGKPPARSPSFAREAETLSRLEIGPGCSIGAHAVIHMGVQLGARSVVGDGAWIRENAVIGTATIVGTRVCVAYSARIGDRVKVMNLSNIAGFSVIEDDVFVGAGVITSNDNELGRVGYVDDQIRGPWLKRGCAIGSGACILPGVSIGERTIVGAGAVVTKDLEANVVAYGIPAKVVRRG